MRDWPEVLAKLTARDEGAEIPATKGMRAAMAFCMSSKEMRPETRRKQSERLMFLRRASPMTLSRALWRPMSSRRTRRSPVFEKIPEA